MTESITIYRAKKVVTLDHARPEAEAVAVRGDRIIAAGSMDELSVFSGATVDDRYADDVIFPGLVEAHAHAGTGPIWKSPYVGYFERTDPQGRVWPGCKTFDEVIARLQEAEAELIDPEAPLFAWGLDPIYFGGERLYAKHLDRVSTTRPIRVQHANGHLCTVNTALMRKDGIDHTVTVEGVDKDSEGNPTGELQEFAAMGLARSADRSLLAEISVEGLVDYGQAACNTGTTTIVDLATRDFLTEPVITAFRQAADDDRFKVRVAPFFWGSFPPANQPLDEVVAQLQAYDDYASPKLLTGYVKLVLDGSIQSWTARLQEPGYLNTDRNGIWIVSPEQFEATYTAYHKGGFTIHVHCNGDEATELMLETTEKVLEKYPRPNHRHTVTHSQLSTAAQYRKMANLGLNANIFSNHIWYWGDQHLDITVGPDRAQRMNAAATALREGVSISLHSDSPVTQLGPLATASYAVERKTATGRDFGPHERISIEEAMRAVTLGSAYQLGLDHLVGSIESGKYADFAILDRNPLEVSEPAELRDIEVKGTVLGGEHQAVARP